MKIIKQFGLLFAALLPAQALALDLALNPGQHTLDLSPLPPVQTTSLLLLASNDDITQVEANNGQNNQHLLRGLALNIPTDPDREGLWSDTKLFMLYQVGMVGVIWLLPESISKWDDEDKNGNIFKKWDDNVSNLRRDKDDWGINYIGHPYFGAVYYVRARNRGYNQQNSFWYSVGMSTLYEYGIEALFEPVSVQDLIFTPVGGAIMGEYFLTARNNIRNRILATGKVTTSDKVKLFFTDPLGVINEKVEHMIHDEASLNVFPVVNRKTIAAADGSEQIDTYYGLQAMLRW